jgi:hypothetical protein
MTGSRYEVIDASQYIYNFRTRALTICGKRKRWHYDSIGRLYQEMLCIPATSLRILELRGVK